MCHLMQKAATETRNGQLTAHKPHMENLCILIYPGSTNGCLLNTPVLTKHRSATLYFQVYGLEKTYVQRICLDTQGDREKLPEIPRLRDLLMLAVGRSHPQVQYLVEQYGVVIMGYIERPSFSQSMACIEYGPDPQ